MSFVNLLILYASFDISGVGGGGRVIKRRTTVYSGNGNEKRCVRGWKKKKKKKNVATGGSRGNSSTPAVKGKFRNENFSHRSNQKGRMPGKQ